MILVILGMSLRLFRRTVTKQSWNKVTIPYIPNIARSQGLPRLSESLSLRVSYHDFFGTLFVFNRHGLNLCRTFSVDNLTVHLLRMVLKHILIWFHKVFFVP